MSQENKDTNNDGQQTDLSNNGSKGADGGSGQVDYSKLTPDEIRKIAEERNNFQTALSEERTKRKSDDKSIQERLARLDEIEKKEQERKEKELKKNGEYETLLTQKDEENAKLRKQIEDLSPFKDLHLERVEKEKKSLLEKIDPANHEFVMRAIEGKDDKTALEMLETFSTKFSKPNSFGQQPGGDGKKQDKAADLSSAIQEGAKKGGFSGAFDALLSFGKK